MKKYEVHYVHRGGFPGNCFDEFEAETDKKAKILYRPYFNKSVNRGHCGIRIFRVSDNRCIMTKLWKA